MHALIALVIVAVVAGAVAREWWLSSPAVLRGALWLAASPAPVAGGLAVWLVRRRWPVDEPFPPIDRLRTCTLTELQRHGLNRYPDAIAVRSERWNGLRRTNDRQLYCRTCIEDEYLQRLIFAMFRRLTPPAGRHRFRVVFASADVDSERAQRLCPFRPRPSKQIVATGRRRKAERAANDNDVYGDISREDMIG